MKSLFYIALTITAAAQLPPTINRRISDLESKEAAVAEKTHRQIVELRKAAAAELIHHAGDLAKANQLEAAGTAKRLADSLASGAGMPLKDWLKGRVLLRDYLAETGKPFITFSDDGATCKMPWGEVAKVETTTDHLVQLRAPSCMVYMEVALDRTNAAVMSTRVPNVVWLCKPARVE